jgi:hypothetical protein
MENGTVELHPHFHKRLLERKVEFASAVHVLNKGIVRREPEFSVRFQQWRYLVEGKDPLTTKNLAIAFTFIEEHGKEILVLTVMD